MTHAADDYSAINRSLRNLRAPAKYAIWFRNQWAGIGTDINKITFFDTAAAAETALKENTSPEAYAECEVRPYPGE